jgi:hypothetical protein
MSIIPSHVPAQGNSSVPGVPIEVDVAAVVLTPADALAVAGELLTAARRN